MPTLSSNVFRVLVPIIGGALLAASPAAPEARAGGSEALPLEPCHLSTRLMPARIRAECGSLPVPENRDDPDGRRIELKVAVVPAQGRRRAEDPLVFITGGPGQSALESWVGVGAAFRRINRERDILLVDQRGTGGSSRLQCELDDPMMERAPDPARVAAMTGACLEELPGDPRFYTTSVAVRDLDAVREALGYPRLNLYGVSYGSRVAQAYMRRYPDRVRSAILDGVVPQDLALGPDISLDAQRALEMMFRRCAADEACNRRFPGLAEQFGRVQARLREAPVELVVADPTTGELRDQVFSEFFFTGVVRMFSYAPETVALLPLLIDHAARNGDFAPLAAQALMVSEQMDDAIAIGMHHAVVCTEDVPFVRAPDARRDETHTTYLGMHMFDFLEQVCRIWPAGVIDDDFKQPLRSDIPTLLLSGEADPVTPPANGERAAAGLSNSLHLVGRGQGHGMAMRGCTPKLMAEFVAAAGVADLDASCLDGIRPAPFFMRFTGPDP